MSKFKAGDRVKCMRAHCDVTEGQEYNVTRVDEDGTPWIVDDVGDQWYLSHGEFEVVPAAEAEGETFIVYYVATSYPTLAEAEDHIKRVADAGDVYYIAKQIRKVKVSEVTTVTLEDA